MKETTFLGSTKLLDYIEKWKKEHLTIASMTKDEAEMQYHLGVVEGLNLVKQYVED